MNTTNTEQWIKRSPPKIEPEDLVWVKLADPQKFLIIMETLTRIGIASKTEKKLTQSCHILHKRGGYTIVHFKELFLLDGKDADFTEEDKARRNTIVNLLDDWGLLEQEDVSKTADNTIPVSQIKIITANEKPEWELVAKYTIGKKPPKKD